MVLSCWCYSDEISSTVEHGHHGGMLCKSNINQPFKPPRSVNTGTIDQSHATIDERSHGQTRPNVFIRPDSSQLSAATTSTGTSDV